MSLTRTFTWLVLGFQVCSPAWAVATSQVLEVSAEDRAVISQRETPWHIGNRVCVLRDWKEVACGTVIYSGGDKAEVRLTELNDSLRAGDWVQAAKEPTAPALETPSTAVAAVDSGKGRAGFKVVTVENYQVSLNATGGPSYFSASLHFERAWLKHWSLGVKASYQDSTYGNVTGKGPGVLLTVNRYGRKKFEGFWVQAAVGEYFLSQSGASPSHSWSAFYASMGAGLRNRVGARGTLGVLLGARFFQSPPGALNTQNQSAFSPVLSLEYGLVF